MHYGDPPCSKVDATSAWFHSDLLWTKLRLIRLAGRLPCVVPDTGSTASVEPYDVTMQPFLPASTYTSRGFPAVTYTVLARCSRIHPIELNHWHWPSTIDTVHVSSWRCSTASARRRHDAFDLPARCRRSRSLGCLISEDL